MIKDDDTYVLNPTAGTYSGIVAIQVNGVAYNTSGTYPTYYTVKGANNYVYFNGQSSSITTRYHLDLTQNTTIQFAKELPVTYTVTVNGESSFLSLWNMVFTKGDRTTLSPSSLGTYSDILSIQITGQAYQQSGDSSFWYTVKGANNQTYIDGTASPNTTTFNLNLTQNITISIGYREVCFSKNMMVRMADGTDKPIGEVYPGDMVKAYNCVHNSEDEEIVDAEVKSSSAGLYQTEPKYEKYTFSNGTVIEVVNRDRLYNVEENKMKWTDEWEIGEHALTYDGQEVALVSHETINKEIQLYTFICDYANYFINGLLAGHKTARYPFLPSRHNPKN